MESFLYSETFVCKEPNNEHGWIWHQDSRYLDYVGCGALPAQPECWGRARRHNRREGGLRVLPFSAYVQRGRRDDPTD